MNYLTELVAFYSKIDSIQLDSSSIALWHALLAIANNAGWPHEFSVAISSLEVKAGLNKKAVERARNKLTQRGLIIWKSRKGNQCAEYTLISLCDKSVYNFVAQTVSQGVPQSVSQHVPQSVAINKSKVNESKVSFYARTGQRDSGDSSVPSSEPRRKSVQMACGIGQPGEHEHRAVEDMKRFLANLEIPKNVTEESP